MQSAFLSHIGDSYGDFLVIKASWLQELDCLFREVEHLPTKAHILHIESKDPENLFCLSFQTLPRDSRGAPHILEHTVLCGSKKYPVKDPFFAMTRRSLNTFMNAFTGADFTCYPAASQVEKDFYHLLEVYVDAVFHANLHEESFLQEGCRLAFTKDETSPLIYQGIVYNEMKGARASCDARMWHAMLEELFPDLPYRYDSGGDPKEIPSLSYEELLTFYKTFYHPSRCLFFFSGDLPLKKHLDFLQEHVFQGVSPLPPLPPIPRQARYLIPHVREVPYQANEDDDIGKVTVAFGFLTCPIVEQEEVLALSVLDSILTDTDASPLKLALLETGLCTQAGGFLDTEMSEVPYLFVCKGCRKEDVERIEEVLMHKLVALSQEPLPQEWVEAALHQFELSHTEISGDHGPFGLTLFFRSALAKQHGCDPEHHLQLHHSFTELRKRLQDPLYLPQVIHKHLVANTHRVRITMIPDPHLGEKETLEEEKQLQEKKKLLSPLACQEILASMKLLEEKQQQEQNFDCLPKVTLADVPIATRDFPLRTIRINNCTVLHHDCFTNHFLYAGISFALPKVISQNLPYLQLLLALIPELGAGTRDYKQQLEYIHAHTGGLSLHASLHVQVEDTSLMKPSLLMRGKSLSRHAKHLLPLMQEVLTIPDLKDHKRIADLIRQIHTSLHNKIQKNSLRYAIQLALSGYSPSTHFTEMCSGSHYFSFMNDLVKNLDTNIHHIVDTLCELHTEVFTFHEPKLICSCSHELVEEMERSAWFDFALPSKTYTPWSPNFPLETIPSQGRIIPAQVAYNVQAYKVASYRHPHAPALTVATQLLENKVLHTKVREQGGAYGASATYLSSTGCFYLHSYRDPHILQTLTTFDEAICSISEGRFSEQDLEEAKLGILQHIDTPISPGGRALLAYEWLQDGKKQEFRQVYREQILSLSRIQLQAAIQAELLPKLGKAVEILCASKSQLKKESSHLQERHPSFFTQPLV